MEKKSDGEKVFKTIYFPHKLNHWDEMVIKFKLTNNANKASFNFCTATGDVYKTQTLEISFTGDKNTLTHKWKEGEITDKVFDKSLGRNREQTHTLVFRMFDGTTEKPTDSTTNKSSPKKAIIVLLKGYEEVEMNLDQRSVGPDEFQYVVLKDGFEYVKAVMFRFNDAPPANHLPWHCKNKGNCAWCACCVNGELRNGSDKDNRHCVD